MRRAHLFWIAAAVVLLAPTLAHAQAADSGSFQSYQQRGWLWMYLGSFGAGFVTSLTPCVYPMIPITLGIFGARGQDVSRIRRLALASSYVLGMGLTYAVLGVVVAMIGGQFGDQLGNPYFVVPIVLLFIALAASMFGAFELNLPQSWQTRLNQVGGSGFGGAFAMGLVGGLIAAPCTGPFLTGLLAFVSTTRDVVHGGSMLFVYALGMGVLFFVVAAFAMSLPKSGRWMEYVKSTGGILLLCGAFYFLRGAWPQLGKLGSDHLSFLAGCVCLVAIGIAIGAVHLSFHGSIGERVRKAVGVALVVGGLAGAWNFYQWEKLDWIVDDEAAAFALAHQTHKGVMVDFGASWCGACHELEGTFGDDAIMPQLTASFVPLRLDVSEGTEAQIARKKRYGAETLPAVVFVTADGEVVGRIDRFLPPADLAPLLVPAIAALHGAPASH